MKPGIPISCAADKTLHYLVVSALRWSFSVFISDVLKTLSAFGFKSFAEDDLGFSPDYRDCGSKRTASRMLQCDSLGQ